MTLLRSIGGHREPRDSGSTSSWAHFSHDADIGVIGMGATKAEAFRRAALALTAVVTDLSKVQPLQPVPCCVKRRVTSCCWSSG
jgi:Archease protein family (MTH1598/TM1083)